MYMMNDEVLRAGAEVLRAFHEFYKPGASWADAENLDRAANHFSSLLPMSTYDVANSFEKECGYDARVMLARADVLQLICCAIEGSFLFFDEPTAG